MDKAPDAFRTISEVADDLDVPQHVLRFWETRFSQIKPMKRSGGRRYYRPDDVDLLRGIRHLLYGEGYTIRGVQRILKEQGIKSVQRLAEGVPLAPDHRPDHEGMAGAPVDDEDEAATDADIAEEEDAEDAEDDAEPAISLRREPVPRPPGRSEPSFVAGPPPAHQPRSLDIERLKGALSDLVACRQLLDAAFADGKDGPPAPAGAET